MKYLQIVNASIVVFGTSMGLILAVVCILYGAQLPHEPQLRGDMPHLYLITVLFSALGGAATAAFVGHRRHWAARWLVQILPVVPGVAIALFVKSLGG